MSVRSPPLGLVAKMARMNTEDEVWDRAAMAGGGPNPRLGDALMSSVLGFHSLAMSGGLLSAVEERTAEQLEAVEAGYRWLQLDAAADAVAAVRREVETGALDDDERADALELRADADYDQAVPADQTLFDAFQARWHEDPDAFAAV